MAINWVRWNAVTHIYEYSTNDGASFAVLPLDASILNEGIIGSIARIASGTADGTKFVRDDRTLVQPASTGLSDTANIARLNAGNVFSVVNNSFSELLAVNKGLIFPATQVASSGVNDFDDYEEGGLTPTFGGTVSESGQVYSIQGGRYIKAGKFVHFSGRVALSTLGTITGQVVIKGLPFVAQNTANTQSPISIGYFDALTTAVVYTSGYISPNTSEITLTKLTAAATTIGNFAQADFSNTTDMMFSGHYEAAA